MSGMWMWKYRNICVTDDVIIAAEDYVTVHSQASGFGASTGSIGVDHRMRESGKWQA
jgi:hypothetical protein